MIVNEGFRPSDFLALSFSEELEVVDAARKRIALAPVNCVGAGELEDADVFIDFSDGAFTDAGSLVVLVRL